MANSFGTDILIQAEDPKKAASFYVDHLGFKLANSADRLRTVDNADLITVKSRHVAQCSSRHRALSAPTYHCDAIVKIPKSTGVLLESQPNLRIYVGVSEHVTKISRK